MLPFRPGWGILAVAMFSFALLFVYASNKIDIASQLPVKSVHISGAIKFTHGLDLKQVIEHHTAKGFFGFSARTLQQDLVSLPWIRTVAVRRSWPWRLQLAIQEYSPVALWNDSAFMTSEFNIFSPPPAEHPQIVERVQALRAQLPQLRGAQGRHAAVAQLYRSVAAVVGSGALRVIAEDERLAVRVELNTGQTILLGRSQREARLQRLRKIFTKLAAMASWDRVTRVDLRYDNGVVLRHTPSAA